ncbi:MAG: sugar phosphate isomerase/epimerase family protein [Planctomycetia bacterium]
MTYNTAADLDLEALVKRCEEVGLLAVELRTTHKHGVEPSLSVEDRKKVRRRFEASGVELFGLGSICEFDSPQAEVVAKNVTTAVDFVRLAHDVGATGVKVRPNGLHEKEGVAAADTVKQIAAALGEVGREAEGLGVEVWVEVHGRGTDDPRLVRRILDACGCPAVGATWNSNPADVAADGTIAVGYAALEPFVRCVHIHDLFEDYPYRELFRRLRQSSYQRYTMIEMAGGPEIERLLRYYRKLWVEWSAS